MAAFGLASCGGNNTFSPSVTGAPVTVVTPQGDWTIALSSNDSIVKAKVATRATTTDLGTLDTVTGYPGFTNPIFSSFTGFLAESLDGFTGTLQLADVPSGTPDHVPCQFSPGNGSSAPTSTLSVTPTTAGAPFTVFFTIPSNYTYPSTTLKYQATDNYSRVKTVEIAVTTVAFNASFAPVTFSSFDDSDSGTLSIATQNDSGGSINVTFDTNIQASDNVPAAFDNPLPSGVTVSGPTTPVTITGANTTLSAPVNFSWSSWPAGNYAVIAVLSQPQDVAGAGETIRVPCEITVTSRETVVRRSIKH